MRNRSQAGDLNLNNFRNTPDISAHPVASQLDPALIARLGAALPQMKDWILRYTDTNGSQARPVASLSIPGLDRCYPKELLESTRVVIADEICYPPLDQFGLGEFKILSETPWSGITYNDIYFL